MCALRPPSTAIRNGTKFPEFGNKNDYLDLLSILYTQCTNLNPEKRPKLSKMKEALSQMTSPTYAQPVRVARKPTASTPQKGFPGTVSPYFILTYDQR